MRRVKNVHGSILIEVTIASALVVLSFLALFLTFSQLNKTRASNSQKSIALTLLGTQINQDSQTAYLDLSDTYPPISAIDSLPGASLTRTVIANNSQGRQVKTVRYRLQWRGLNGTPQTLLGDYVLTNQGLAND